MNECKYVGDFNLKDDITLYEVNIITISLYKVSILTNANKYSDKRIIMP
jgi:hypothetical protein